MEPDMNMPKQVRKAATDVQAALDAGDTDRARYMLGLLVEMVSEPQARWQPWSYYVPRVAEEFGDGERDAV
ncbi:hypothetical protein [Mycobacteroides abscessus]|nr:hypothetical protein [Mycobacteroides abscessus]EIU86259.1 hypothetical protein MM2B0626_1006 [Mycobacteroides abscessus subsp. bolletii 2B-0626]EIV14643.1 hypothetical protein MM2B0912R_1407 [Mycobacteroides abscessus subsp. bolletii 2B-0912-R]EIV27314.1 hypothetical protein MM2B0912S_1007 [Mycobacteroides abscessus subsp. bolletii 2B-0912-S]EIV80233.1 hypothetical protein MM2B1231_1068 [Mycobacteroides abscessus subsp. bolletii 2B-1231]EIV80950.1 hypothetical protein MM2B0107_0343 [Mycoba